MVVFRPGRESSIDVKVVIKDLTQHNLKDTPEWSQHPFSCRYCTYWEFPEECVDPGKDVREEMWKKKLEWLQNTRRDFGNCGKLLYVNGTPAGYAQYAPAKFLPNSVNYVCGPPSDDAVLISCLFICRKDFRGRGLGSLLLKNILDALGKREIRAVETFARRGKANNPSGPVEFYLKNGFRIHENASEFPLMRLEF